MKYGRNRHANGYIGNPEMFHQFGRCNLNNHYFVESKIRTPTNFDIERDVRYKRPTDWLAMPDMTNGDQKVAILLDIVNGSTGNTGATADSNFIAFAISGAYIVDWGDGTTQAFVAGATASKQYSWFGVSGGTNSVGNRQVLVQAYPQQGATFDWIDFNRRYPLPWRPAMSTTEYIKDIKIAGTGFRAVNFHRGTVIPNNATTLQVSMPFLEKVEFVGETGITSAKNMLGDNTFTGRTLIKTVKGTQWSKNVGDFEGFLNGGGNPIMTQDILDLDVSSSGKDYPNAFAFQGPNGLMFQSNFVLQYIPKFDLRQANCFFFPFNQCYALLFMERPIVEGAWREQNYNLLGHCRIRSFDGWVGEIGALGITMSATGASSNPNFRLNYPSFYQPFIAPQLSRLTNLQTANIRVYQDFFAGGFNNQTTSSIEVAPVFNFNKVTSTFQMFTNCTSLQYIPPYRISSAVNTVQMFGNCRSLRNFPSTFVFEGGSGDGITNSESFLNYSTMFSGCSSIRFPPDFTIGVGVTGGTGFRFFMAGTFSGCFAMKKAPRIISPQGTLRNTESLFENCSNIVDFSEVNKYDTTGVLTFRSMFSGCRSMTAAPSFSVARGMTFTSMFSGCMNLVIPPSMSGWGSASTGNTMTVNEMFGGCISLGKDPTAYTILANYDFSKVKNAASMFNGCANLLKLPSENWNTSGIIDMRNFFSLTNGGPESIPYLDVSGVTHNTNLSDMFVRLSSFQNQMKRLGITGVRASIDVRNQLFSATALNDIFQGLSAGRGGLTPGTIRTITIFGNPGRQTCDRTIATNKQWSVSG